MKESAKKLLCNDPERFQKVYGDYYVSGYQMGSHINIEMSSKTTKTDKSKAISGSVEGAWSGYGVDVEGKASFSKAVRESKDLSVASAKVTMSGHNKGDGI